MPNQPETAVSGQEYLAVQASPEFQELRSRLRRFVFPMTRVLPDLVLHLRPARRVRPRLHGHQGVGQHQRRPAHRPWPVPDDVRHHRPLRPVRQPGTRPARRGDPRRARRRCGMTITSSPHGSTVGNPVANIGIFALFVVDHAVHRDPRQQEERHRRRVLHRRARASPGRRTASRSPATTCRPPASSASRAPSRSTATTASSTPSASWSPGWSRCCWSPNCCATQANSRWPTC